MVCGCGSSRWKVSLAFDALAHSVGFPETYDNGDLVCESCGATPGSSDLEDDLLDAMELSILQHNAKEAQKAFGGEDSIALMLPDGGALICGPGEKYQYGGDVKIVGRDGFVTAYWDVDEWKRHPESVMGAIFSAARGVGVTP